MTSIPGPSPRTVFRYRERKRLRFYWYILLVTFLVGAIQPLSWFTKGAEFHSDLWIYIVVALISLAYFYNPLVKEMRLTTDDAGIGYQGPFYSVTSSWDDLQVGKFPALISKLLPARRLGLKLTSKSPVTKRNFWTFYHLYDLWGGKDRYFIPLSPQIWEQYDELFLVIRKHRPDLDMK
jgi:hypothetical protein